MRPADQGVTAVCVDHLACSNDALRPSYPRIQKQGSAIIKPWFKLGSLATHGSQPQPARDNAWTMECLALGPGYSLRRQSLLKPLGAISTGRNRV